jgi:hypothetical protein
LALGLLPIVTASPAHADIGDFITDPIANAVDHVGGLLNPGADVDGLSGAASAEAVPFDSSGDTASVPLRIEGVGAGQPVIDISIGGEPSIPVAVDTGSKGLEVPIWLLNPQDIFDELQHFSFDDLDIQAFPAGVTVGLDVPTTIDFGHGIVTDQTTVDAILFSFPFSAIDAQALGGIGVDGILGIGPNAGGSHLVTGDLPGVLGDGVLIDEPAGRLVFGPEPAAVDGFDPLATLSGAPYPGDPHDPDDIQVQIGDGPKQDVAAVFDSGGKNGYIPATLAGNDASYLFGDFGVIPPGTSISVYTQDGDLLYSYATPHDMLVLPDWLPKPLGGFMNTGNAAFADNPVYISNNDGGAMTFYGMHSPSS